MKWILLSLASAIVFVVYAPACSSEQQCFAAVYCHKDNCSGPIVRSGCESCQAGEVDDSTCPKDSGAGD